MHFFSLSIALLSTVLAGNAGHSQGVQTPSVITAEAQAIGERFSQVLEEECPINICNPIGCEATRFLTLDETQDSSLPGMASSEPTAKTVQYKLASVKCEFTYEPTFDESKLAGLRQRLLQRVKQGNVNIQLVSRKLMPKAEIPAMTPKPSDEAKKVPQSKEDMIAQAFAPFLPWITVILVVGVFATLALIIRYRHKLRTALSTITADETPKEIVPVVSAGQLMERTEYLRRIYRDDASLSELAVRPLLESNDLDELCRILKHYGPEVLASFKQRGQFEQTLDALAAKYQDYTARESPEEFWTFLERSERRLTAAKVRMTSDPLAYEFAFMDRMQVDELIGLLRDLSELEGLAIIVNGPQRLRQELFASAGPAFVAKFIKYLTGQERLADQFVRQAVQKARQIYEEKGGALRVVPVNKLPLLEDALNALNSKQRVAVLGEMQKDQPQVLSAVTQRIFLDASLAKLPEDILTEAFLLIPPRAAAAYIDSLEGQVDVMSRLKPRLQDAIKQYIGSELLDRNLVKEARQAIATYVKEKDTQGVIDLGKINSSLFT